MSATKASAKRKKLPKEFAQMLEESTDLTSLQALFETCEIDARGGNSEQTA
jgi:hypothetical protein